MKHLRNMVGLGFSGLLVWGVVSTLSAVFASSNNYAFFFPAVFQYVPALEWTDVSIPNIVAATFEIDPNQPETLYIGAADYQGAWRSQNGGDSWVIMNNGLPITATFRHLATAPLSPTLIYAGAWGSYPHQVYRSFDGGDNWQGLGQIHSYRLSLLAVNPVTPTTVYAGIGIFDSPTVGGEVYRSMNGGIDWTQILPSFTLAQDIVVDPQNPNNVYIGRSSGGMIKSSDGGDTWQAINNGLPSDSISVYQILLRPDNSHIIYIVTGEGLFRSVDGGDSWASFGDGLPVPWLSSLTFVPNSPDTLFAAPVESDDYYGIYRSVDGGNTWQWFVPSPVNERPIKMAVQQVADESNLFVLFDGYGSEGERFWKLGPILP